MVGFKKLQISDTQFLAYNKFIPQNFKTEVGDLKIGVIFLSGFMSDMEGSKAMFLEHICIENNIAFVRFDYSGCGKSSGNFDDYAISDWKNNCLAIIDDFTEVDKIILVGSSMGGWLMLLAALERKHKIHSLLGIASAPDFTEDLIWDELDDKAQKEIMEKSFYKMPTDYCDDPNNSKEDNYYIITKKLIEDGRENLLLNQDYIDIGVDTIFIHGMKDEDVPYKYSMILKEKLLAKNVEVIIQKEGQHRMSSEEDLILIEESLRRIINL